MKTLAEAINNASVLLAGDVPFFEGNKSGIRDAVRLHASIAEPMTELRAARECYADNANAVIEVADGLLTDLQQFRMTTERRLSVAVHKAGIKYDSQFELDGKQYVVNSFGELRAIVVTTLTVNAA